MNATSLQPSTLIGPYRIVGPLGAGGMGEVYRAHDDRLDRPVALKILPPDVVHGEDGVRRFAREARSASALSHPNIVTIYDVGHAAPREAETGEPEAGSEPPRGAADPVHYIAMELVEGVTLRRLLDDHSTSLRVVLGHLAQAAEGLGRAHDAGIVHRDLKPENIMVSLNGYTKILDFGLAKHTRSAPSGVALTSAPTEVAESVTREGVVMGTVGYMSPEQATGRTVGHRTDVFSFGCLLYEAAAGRRPFTGESAIDVLHAIIRSDPPPIAEVAPQVPRALVRLIRRCLAKEPAKRLHSMQDVALQLHDLVEEWDALEPTSGLTSGQTIVGGLASTPGGGHSTRQRFKVAVLGLVALTIAVIATLGVLRWRAPAPEEGVPPTAFDAMRIRTATSIGRVQDASISPDGEYLVTTRKEAEGTSLWLRRPASGNDVQLVAPRSDFGVLEPVITPDGHFVDYLEEDGSRYRSLFRIPLLGGPPRRLAVDVDTRVAHSPTGDRLAFIRNLPGQGQSVIVLTVDDGEEHVLAHRGRDDSGGFDWFRGPAWSNDGTTLAAIGWQGSKAQIVLIDLADGRQQVLADHPWVWIDGLDWVGDDSALVIAAIWPGQALLAQLWRVDLADQAVKRITNDTFAYAGVSLSADGKSLASVQSLVSSSLWRQGLEDPGRGTRLTSGSREQVDDLSVSADGTLYLTHISDGEARVARWPPEAETPIPLSPAGMLAESGIVSANGRVIVFRGMNSEGLLGLFAMDTDGGPLRLVTDDRALPPFDVAADGTWCVVRDDRGLWRQPLDGGEATLLFEVASAFVQALSPDGTHLAFYTIHDTPGAESDTTAHVLRLADKMIVAERKWPRLRPIRRVQWSPNGQTPDGQTPGGQTPGGHSLDVLIRRGAGSSLWRVDYSDEPPRLLLDFEDEEIGSFRWQPDGAGLYLTRVESSSDVVIIEGWE